MIRTHHQQPTLWTGFLKEEVSDLWEPWMRQADELLDDTQLIDQVFEAQGRRCAKSRTRGPMQTPSEVVPRLLVLKHARELRRGRNVRILPKSITHSPLKPITILR